MAHASRRWCVMHHHPPLSLCTGSGGGAHPLSGVPLRPAICHSTGLHGGSVQAASDRRRRALRKPYRRVFPCTACEHRRLAGTFEHLMQAQQLSDIEICTHKMELVAEAIRPPVCRRASHPFDGTAAARRHGEDAESHLQRAAVAGGPAGCGGCGQRRHSSCSGAAPRNGSKRCKQAEFGCSTQHAELVA